MNIGNVYKDMAGYPVLEYRGKTYPFMSVTDSVVRELVEDIHRYGSWKFKPSELTWIYKHEFEEN